MVMVWDYARWRIRNIAVRSALIVLFFGLAQILYVLPYLLVARNFEGAAVSLVAVAAATLVFFGPLIEARVLREDAPQRKGPERWNRV